MRPCVYAAVFTIRDIDPATRYAYASRVPKLSRPVARLAELRLEYGRIARRVEDNRAVIDGIRDVDVAIGVGQTAGKSDAGGAWFFLLRSCATMRSM